jgi:hypothetical protein
MMTPDDSAIPNVDSSAPSLLRAETVAARQDRTQLFMCLHRSTK